MPDGRPADEQPAWRRDFPIDWPEDQYVARRDFVKFLVLTSVAFVVGQAWIVVKSLLARSREPPAAAEVARLAEVPVGGVRTSSTTRAGARRLLVRLDERRWSPTTRSARTCSCPVVPRAGAGELDCPCHNGRFDLETGRPLAGPPRRPLPRVVLEVRGGLIFATGVEERTT